MGVVGKAVMLFWDAEEVVIYFVIQIDVMKDADGIGARR